MPKLNDREGNVSLELNIIDNNFLDVQFSRQDYENWIPFEFVLNVGGERYAYIPDMGATFTVYEIKNLITKLEQIANSKIFKKSFDKFEFSSTERYFDLIIYDPLEDEEIYIEIWINMGTITNGKVSGYDKGFRFIVKLDSFIKFTNEIKEQLRQLMDF